MEGLGEGLGLWMGRGGLVYGLGRYAWCWSWAWDGWNGARAWGDIAMASPVDGSQRAGLRKAPDGGAGAVFVVLGLRLGCLWDGGAGARGWRDVDGVSVWMGRRAL